MTIRTFFLMFCKYMLNKCLKARYTCYASFTEFLFLQGTFLSGDFFMGRYCLGCFMNTYQPLPGWNFRVSPLSLVHIETFEKEEIEQPKPYAKIILQSTPQHNLFNKHLYSTCHVPHTVLNTVQILLYLILIIA